MTKIRDLLGGVKALYLFNSGIPKYTLSTKMGDEYSSYELSDLIPFQFTSTWNGVRIARLYHMDESVIQVVRNNATAKNFYMSIEKFLNLDEK